MPIEYTVRQGECLSSIGAAFGLLPDTIWAHPDNAALRGQREDSRVLRPGDILQLPDVRREAVPCATERRHRFRRKGVPEKVRVELVDASGKPRANLRWVAVVDDVTYEGKTGADGVIEIDLPPGVRRGELALGDALEEIYQLLFGETDPIDDDAGLQKRLRNLGYACGPVDGIVGPKTRAALRAFQKAQGLDATGEPDARTRAALLDAHKS